MTMVQVFEWLLVGMALVLALPALVLLAQTLAFIWPCTHGNVLPLSLPNSAQPVSFKVLMPAHNEAGVLEATLQSLASEVQAMTDIWVIADNCKDDTASIARRMGASVTERQDTEKRGKGYALDWGVSCLRGAPPDVVIVIDADCQVAPGSLRALANASHACGLPVQSLYAMALPPQPSLAQRVAAFAWRFKTEVRAIGYHRMGLPCQLMGTGMAFPWTLIDTAPLASGNTVEDLNLGLDLALQGAPARLLPSASVGSVFPSSSDASSVQRTRWEQGHLQTLMARLPGLLAAGARRGSLTLLAIGLDISVPPLSLFVMLQVLMAAVALVFSAWTGAWLPFGLAFLSLLMLGLCIALAWFQVGQSILSAQQLLAVPAYVWAKIPMYLNVLLGKAQRQWVRTPRDGHGE